MSIIFHLINLFYRFMGDSKRSVKNKARVEGSICASYLHREITHFCSHYFTNFTLRNERSEMQNDCVRHPLMLSVFGQSGRHSGKESIHWLTDEEYKSAHVHVLNNCIEVKPYIEYVYQYFHSINCSYLSSHLVRII